MPPPDGAEFPLRVLLSIATLASAPGLPKASLRMPPPDDDAEHHDRHHTANQSH